MRAAFAIVLAWLVISCDGPVDVEVVQEPVFRDTILTTSEWVGSLFVEHHTLYDTAGNVSLRSEHITAYDTITSTLTEEARNGGRTFRFGPYQIWTRSISEDTSQVMVDSVRTGKFLCIKDSVAVPDAMVIERRTEGYGTYRNAGILVARGTSDTVLLWYRADRGMSRPVVWNWEEHVPMSWEEYSEEKRRMSETSQALSDTQPGPVLQAGK